MSSSPVPVAWFCRGTVPPGGPSDIPRGAKHAGGGRASRADQPIIDQRLADLGDAFDLTEPFQRICQAIEEAQQAVR